MAETRDKSQAAAYIHQQADGDRQFVLHPDNDDLFVQTGKQIIEACRLNIGIKVWLDELRAVIDHVSSWCSQRATHIRSCLASPRGGKIVFFFIPPGEHFDFDLADDMSNLNREIIQQFNIGMIEVYQLPWAEVWNFMHADSARLIYGEQPSAHPAVEA